MALLKLFALVRGPLRLDPVVAHLDHLLRGESGADARFVESAARREGMPFVGSARDVKRISRQRKISIEEAAREARYDFLFETARKRGASAVATAHTMDDQTETVLMRLLRGSGLKGLGAISAKRQERGVALIRPLLGFRKRELKSFLRAAKFAWREDASNESDDYFRNRVRNRLLPHILKNYGPQFDSHLLSLADSSREIHDYMAGEASAAYRKIAKKRGSSVSLDVRALAALHPALRSEVIFLAAERVSGTRRVWKRPHIEALARLVEAAPGGESHHLPHGLRALRGPSSIRLYRAS